MVQSNLRLDSMVVSLKLVYSPLRVLSGLKKMTPVMGPKKQEFLKTKSMNHYHSPMVGVVGVKS